MSSIRAIVVDPDVPGRFVIKEVEAPQAGPSEAIVQVLRRQPYRLLASPRSGHLRKEGRSCTSEC
ncbi:MAG TPA: hypothetical protein VNE38_08855 [Ktedonobacteraceae bacterium]|nr:hypothetical protein [Ktedonobacteraceae bacterium]